MTLRETVRVHTGQWEAVQPGGSSPGGRDKRHAHQAPVWAVQGADERQNRPVQARGVLREAGGQHEREGRTAHRIRLQLKNYGT